jgi:hypothetical protein
MWIVKTFDIQGKEKLILASFDIMLAFCHYAEWIFFHIRRVKKWWIAHDESDSLLGTDRAD